MRFFVLSIYCAFISTSFGQAITLHDHLNNHLSTMEKQYTAGNGDCFFHACEISRADFKTKLFAIKSNQANTNNPQLQQYASSKQENDSIFQKQHMEYESNVLLPAQHFTDAEAAAYLFGYTLMIYERSQTKPETAILSAVYNPNMPTIKHILMTYHTGPNLKYLCGHYDRLTHITKSS